ncbi:MAG: MYXO-CTERM sorting domain-containing protein [Planctomycetota bacterium]|nr:MYXO-CTERM sorting domain-containing protein [Planctomycetota bacterium]
MRSLTRRGVVVAALALAASSVHGATIWNESSQGDLPDDRLTPGVFVLAQGDNILEGVLEGFRPDGSLDRDFVTLTILPGFRLTRIDLLDYQSDDFAAFIGVQPGAVFFPDPDDVTPNDLLGWALFGPQDIGTDILPDIGAQGTGFTPPLEAGTYALWIQQTGTLTNYSASFVVEQIPAPGAASLVLVSLGLLRRRR